MAVGLITASIFIVFANVGVEYFVNETLRINDLLVIFLLSLALFFG